MRLPSKTNVIVALLFTMSVAMLASTAYFLSNITVLQDWRLSIPAGDIHVGDTVVIQSTYVKLRDTSGESTRYITCQNREGVWVRYELNKATPNRAKGRGGTGIVVVVRRDIADIPARCKFEVAIRYDVLPLKSVYVNNQTEGFTLLPERTVPTADPATTQSTLLPAPSVTQGFALSSPNSTTSPIAVQPNNVQAEPTPTTPAENPPPVEEQPNVVQRVVNVIRGLF